MRARVLGVDAGPAASSAPRWSALAILALGAAISLAMNLPGHMSYDSVLQLAQGRAGIYNNWHPPVMAWLLGLFDSVVRGTALFVVFNTLLLYGGLAIVALTPPRTTWLAPPLLVIWAAIPDGLIYPGIVWKDVLFTASAFAGFVGLVLAALNWPLRRLRFYLIAGGFLLMALAALSRQNGLVILPVAAIASGWIAARSGAHRRIHSAIAYALLPLVGAGLVMVAGNAALQTRSDGEPSQMYEMRDLQAYDLAGALRTKPDLSLSRLDAADPGLARLLRVKAAPAYTPVRLDSISAMPDLDKALFDTPDSAVPAQWRDLVLGHPWLYLKVRARDFYWVLATPDVDACLPFVDGVDGPEPWVTRLGLKNHEGPKDLALKAWGEPITHSPLFWHPLYAAIALALMALLLRRRRTSDIAMAGLLAAALAFT
ncbi:MAG TPA: hypothetical protein VHX64_12055, partial [Caulobacteraceae bacterium]|nr:hypothetical protein [Caulobacteraceae bacterium]